MSPKTAITVNRPPEEVRSLFGAPDWVAEHDAIVTFASAPGDRGTEIHVALGKPSLAGRLTGSTMATVKNELRRFKQRTETGEIPRSDGTPEGERVGRKFKQRPAQPLASDEREKAGVA